MRREPDRFLGSVFVGFGALRDSRTLGAVGRCSAWGLRIIKCAKRPPQGSRHRNISPTVR